MKITIYISENEYNTLEGIVDEHKENIASMSEDEDIKERKKEIAVADRLLKRIKKALKTE